MSSTTKSTQTYQQAGVNIDAGNALVERIKPLAKQTKRPEVLDSIGGFGGLFALPMQHYQEPVLVSCTDGVGTKLRLAIEHQDYSGIGTDLVAMCANDLIVVGAEPLFFLDYFATGTLDVEQATQVIQSIANACKETNMSLLGGETAEMPGLYQSNDFDLAGFCVGVVEKQKLINAKTDCKAGDVLIGVASSGFHANGFSLIRKLLTEQPRHAPSPADCLTPTKLYVKPILNLIKAVPVHGIAHITGGGLLENIPRILGEQVTAHIDVSTWPRPTCFTWLQQAGNIDEMEMLRTFNCGLGLVLAVPADSSTRCIDMLKQSGEIAWPIGHLAKRDTQDTSPIQFTGLS